MESRTKNREKTGFTGPKAWHKHGDYTLSKIVGIILVLALLVFVFAKFYSSEGLLRKIAPTFAEWADEYVFKEMKDVLDDGSEDSGAVSVPSYVETAFVQLQKDLSVDDGGTFPCYLVHDEIPDLGGYSIRFQGAEGKTFMSLHDPDGKELRHATINTGSPCVVEGGVDSQHFYNYFFEGKKEPRANTFSSSNFFITEKEDLFLFDTTDDLINLQKYKREEMSIEHDGLDGKSIVYVPEEGKRCFIMTHEGAGGCNADFMWLSGMDDGCIKDIFNGVGLKNPLPRCSSKSETIYVSPARIYTYDPETHNIHHAKINNVDIAVVSLSSLPEDSVAGIENFLNKNPDKYWTGFENSENMAYREIKIKDNIIIREIRIISGEKTYVFSDSGRAYVLEEKDGKSAFSEVSDVSKINEQTKTGLISFFRQNPDDYWREGPEVKDVDYLFRWVKLGNDYVIFQRKDKLSKEISEYNIEKKTWGVTKDPGAK